MAIELKEKKVNDDVSVYHDALTNDPVAIASRHGHGGKFHSIAWHPAFRQMYPETNDLVNMNVGNNVKSDQVKNTIITKYSKILDKPKRDPLKVVYAGKAERPTHDPVDATKTAEFDEFHLHDDDGKHIATISVAAKNKLMQYIGVDPDVFKHYSADHQGERTQLTFVGEHPSAEKFELSRKKHPGHDPIALMYQVRHWLDNKDREPNFVGSHSSPNLKVFKTRLQPEEASQKYMQHLQNHQSYKMHSFSRVAPTVFYAMRPTGISGQGKHEVIDTSQPGIVHHVYIDTFAQDHYHTKPLNEVIE